MTSRKKNICVVNNTHGLMIYFLMCPQDYDNTIFVITDTLPQEIISNLNEVVIFPSFEKGNKYFCLIKKVFYTWYYKVFFLSSLKKRSKAIFGHDHLYFSGLFIDEKFVCLEDGTANYLCPPKKEHQGVKSWMRKICFGYSKNIYGYDVAIKKLILTGLLATPDVLKEKAQLIDINVLWQQATKEQKETFLASFSASNIDYDAEVIVITQPLSEYNLISEEEKIRIYQYIINRYTRCYGLGNICIKPHPRELTDYARIFSCKVINSHIPAQILIFTSRPKVVVSLSSSAGYNLKGCRVDLYGTSLSTELEKKIGYIEGNVDKNIL